jgi:DNA polymerase-3 subunit gamma/tau
MGYTALYREWRPQTFADIVGQEHINRTLQNALKTNRIAHAYLFCGPRGTGKTTTAKVLAKTLNCLKGPGVEPCNSCENCKKITDGISMDVMEIDAASNRGIDEIRDLREKVKFAPAEGKNRIYIIDEVHMLTPEAFNALLKTLEEPPAHVVFILATTEPHKIPLTILSRCQRFDFRRIGIKDITGRLQNVVQDLGIKADEEALGLIAKTSDGGMRDALSVLDQCISFGGDKVSVDDVNAVLGTVNIEFLFKIGECFTTNDITAGLEIVDELVGQGKDVRQFAKDLTEHLRNLLLVQVCSSVDDLVPVSRETLSLMGKQAGALGKDKIISLIEIFTSAEREMKWTSQPRLILELAVIKAGDMVLAGDYTDLQNRISKLEAMRQKDIPLKKTEISNLPKKVDNISIKQEVDIKLIKKLWPDILEKIKKVRMSARAFLIEGEPLRIQDGMLVLSFPAEYAFHKEKVEQPENRSAIEQVIKEITGAELKIKCVFVHEQSDGAAPKAGSGKEEDSFIKQASAMFGGEVIDIID